VARKTRFLTLMFGVAFAGSTMAAPVGALTILPKAVGTISCNVKGTLKFVPALNVGGTSPTVVTLSTSEVLCIGTGDAVNIIGGSSKTSHTEPMNDCATVLDPNKPFNTSQGLLKWKVLLGTQKWAPSTIQFTVGSASGDGVNTPFTTDSSGSAIDDPLIATDGSFTGDIATAHAQIKQTYAQIAAKCLNPDPLKQLKALNIISPQSTFTLTSP
jgi:hypothetical protein